MRHRGEVHCSVVSTHFVSAPSVAAPTRLPSIQLMYILFELVYRVNSFLSFASQIQQSVCHHHTLACPATKKRDKKWIHQHQHFEQNYARTILISFPSSRTEFRITCATNRRFAARHTASLLRTEAEVHHLTQKQFIAAGGSIPDCTMSSLDVFRGHLFALVSNIFRRYGKAAGNGYVSVLF